MAIITNPSLRDERTVRSASSQAGHCTALFAMIENKKTKTRIAIAVFNEVENIRLANSELARIGMGDENIFIVARLGILAGFSEEFCVFHQVPDEVNQKSLIYSKFKKSASLKKETMNDVIDEKIRNELIDFKSWMVERLYKNLEEHLDKGHCLFFVSGLTEPIEQIVYNTLVSCSIDRIQIHDYT